MSSISKIVMTVLAVIVGLFLLLGETLPKTGMEGTIFTILPLLLVVGAIGLIIRAAKQ